MTCNPVHNIGEFYKVLEEFPFTKSKTELDIQYKNYIYELLHELPNHLRLRVLGNTEILGKSQSCMRTQPCVQSPLQK